MNSFLRFLATPLLAAASILYGVGLAFDRWYKCRRLTRLPRPVVSVGNITVGGTGKTPLLIRLAQDLKNLSLNPAVLTRGYQGFLGGTSRGEISDEVALMREKLSGVSVVAGADRVASANALMESVSPDVFILDDGFQHWRLARDFDIVCVDATDPWAGGHCLPWGRLREARCALERASLVVITRSDLVNQFQLEAIRLDVSRWFSGAVIVSVFSSRFYDWADQLEFDPKNFRNAKVVALSAIGNPAAFEAGLKARGAEVFPVRFRDHHVFTERDVDRVGKFAAELGAGVVTTEKDLVKLARTSWGDKINRPTRVLVARLNVEFAGSDQEKWTDFLRGILHMRGGHCH